MIAKVICACFGFALLRLVIGKKKKKFAPLSQPIRHETKSNRDSLTFSRASCLQHVFASSFDWLTGLSVSFVIGQSNYFAFGFTTLNGKLLYETQSLQLNHVKRYRRSHATPRNATAFFRFV